MFDLCFFFGSAGIALLIGLTVMAAPITTFYLWLLWLCFLEGPHLFGTWQRTYFDAQIRHEQSTLLWKSLLWFVPAPLLLGVSYLIQQSWPFQVILGFAALWSFHHVIRQHYGILAIYQMLNKTTPQAKKQDKYLLHLSIWLVVILFLSHHPLNRQILGLGTPSTLEIALQFLLALSLLMVCLFWLMLLWQRYKQKASLKPGVFALFVAVGTALFSLFIVGSLEPLLINPRTPEQMFIATTITNGTLHGMQYIGIVIVTSRRRAELVKTEAGNLSFASRLGFSPVWAYCFLALLSIPYVGLNIIRGGAPLGPEPDSSFAQFFLAIYWGLFFHHYWLDQKIWKPAHDNNLRAELGMS